MDLISLAKQFPDMSVTIRLGDLLEANESLVRKVRTEVEEELERRRVEYGDVLVPKEEVVRMLGVDPSTLWRWEHAGYLRPVRIGVKVKYRKGDLDKLMRSREAAQD